MKKRLEWFIVPCMVTVFGSNSATLLKAQDAAKEKGKAKVVTIQIEDEVDTKNIRNKVAKELANSGISEQSKAQILKDVEDALSKATDAAKIAKKAAVAGAEFAEKAAKDALKDIDQRKNSWAFSTRVFKNAKNDGFRIGIQCVQTKDGDGDASQARLEVMEVVDESPAKKAGIVEGDVLVTVDATKITQIADLTKVLQEAGKNDKEVAIELSRDGKIIKVAVKPTKMKSADVEFENIQMNLPTEGFVFDGETMKSLQDVKKWMPDNLANDGTKVWKWDSESADLKKDMEELKSEMAELKKMIKEMAGKK